MNRLARILLGTLLVVSTSGVPASAQATIETVVGNYDPNGLPATAAPLSSPRGVAVDSSGSLYVADSVGFVYRVDAAGTVSIVAGNGIQDFTGDGGPATSARLKYPWSVAVDSAGNLYIADTFNHRIRKVDPDGTITTVAGNGSVGFSGDGGPATSARLKFPWGVAVDSAGNLYVPDSYHHRIRKVDAGGTITTVAGNGVHGFSGDGGPATSASLAKPRGVAVDAAGNLYIADSNNRRIRRVDADGTITTVAGNGMDGHGGDDGPATNASLHPPPAVTVDIAGNLYVVGDHRVRKVDAGGTITTVAGNGTRGFSGDGGPATSASLEFPRGLGADGSGNLYIADDLNHRIRKVDASGTITTVAGNGEYSFFGDGGPAVSARVRQPWGLAFDAAGNLYLADAGNERVRKVDPAGMITTVAGHGSSPAQLPQHGDGGPAIDARLAVPSGVAVDGFGGLYIADRFHSRIRKVDAGGTIVTAAGTHPGFWGDGGPATSAALRYPYGVTVDGAGNLYIGDTANHRIRRVDAGGTITTAAGTWVSGFSGDGGPATSASLSSPRCVAVDGDGNLYVADRGNHRVRKVDPGGTITTVAGNGIYGFSGDDGPATEASLGYPSGVAIDGDGNLLIADKMNHRIRKVDISGTITTVAGNGIYGFSGDGRPATEASLASPHSVAVDHAGNLYIADYGNDRIRRVTLNQAPVCAAAAGVAAECAGASTAVGLDGTAATDPDGDLLSFSWTTDCPGGSFDDDASATPILTVASAPQGGWLPLECSATLTVSDAGGLADTCVPTPVTVTDTVAPAIEQLAASPDQLWPPNHRMVEVTVSAVAADACDGAPACAIVVVTSDEPVDGDGDGDTAPDWQIVNASTVLLRAERAGGGDGRVYTVSVSCSDAAGNAAAGVVTVSVPLSRGR